MVLLKKKIKQKNKKNFGDFDNIFVVNVTYNRLKQQIYCLNIVKVSSNCEYRALNSTDPLILAKKNLTSICTRTLL
ncbi:MAG: hypothetical protein Kow0049_23610 [Stanieria sp.]